MRSKKKTSSIISKAAKIYRVKCVFSTRVVVEAGVPSGQRYDFRPGQVQVVKAEDYDFLLSKKRVQRAGCCGATPGEIPYFQEA